MVSTRGLAKEHNWKDPGIFRRPEYNLIGNETVVGFTSVQWVPGNSNV